MFRQINSLLKNLQSTKHNKPVGEVIGINKISYKLMKNIFIYG